jgi:hypothetical protein
MHQFQIAFTLLIAAMLGACTANLTNSAEFSAWVGRELILVDTGRDRNWNFWRVPDISITQHSQDYRLNLHDRVGTPKTSMFRNPNRVEDLGSAVGATIIIEHVREYGMETGYPVVLGNITLSNGNSYPFEAEWRPEYSQYVRFAP